MVMANTLEDPAQSRCHLLLYRQVENAADIHRLIMSGQLEATLLKPEMIVAPFQVLVAANKAVRSSNAKKMTTRSLFTEVIFNLSPTRTITESLVKFGLSDSDTEILAVVMDPDVERKVEKLNDQIKGHQVQVEELSSLTNTAKVSEYYKITEEELQVSSLVDSVLCRMACKEFYNK